MDIENLNFANLNELLAWLDNGGDERAKFDMRFWHTGEDMLPAGCGTVCCMGGFGDVILGGKRLPDGGYFDAFGLNAETANMLYYPDLRGYAVVTAAWAARVVRHLMATGEVDWYACAETEAEFDAAAELAEVSE